MSNMLISLTHTKCLALGKLIIAEKCSLCDLIIKNEQVCIRNDKTNKVICRNCIRGLSFINLHSIIKDPNQIDLSFK